MLKLYDFVSYDLELPTYLQTLGFVVAVKSVQVYRYCIRQIQKFSKKLQVQRWIPILTENWGQGSHIHIKM